MKPLKRGNGVRIIEGEFEGTTGEVVGIEIEEEEQKTRRGKVVNKKVYKYRIRFDVSNQMMWYDESLVEKVK